MEIIAPVSGTSPHFLVFRRLDESMNKWRPLVSAKFQFQRGNSLSGSKDQKLRWPPPLPCSTKITIEGRRRLWVHLATAAVAGTWGGRGYTYGSCRGTGDLFVRTDLILCKLGNWYCGFRSSHCAPEWAVEIGKISELRSEACTYLHICL